MCKCNPNNRTPYCGKPGCEWPLAPTPPMDMTGITVAIYTVGGRTWVFTSVAESRAVIEKMLESRKLIRFDGMTFQVDKIDAIKFTDS